MQKAVIPVLLALTFLLIPPMNIYATDTLVQTPFTIIYQNQTESLRVQAKPIMNENGIFVLVTEQGTPSLMKLIKSTDEGATWTSPLLISETNAQSQNRLLAENDNGDLSVCWVEFTPDIVQCSISTDNGDSFTLQTGSATVTSSMEDPIWAYDDNNLIISFVGDDDAEYRGAIVSNDFGVTWEDDIKLIDNPEELLEEFYLAESIIHGMNFYVAFQNYDDDVGIYVVNFVKSNDNGATWSSPLVVNSEDIDVDLIGLNFEEDGGKIIITYLSEFVTQARSDDGGTSFVETVIDPEFECDTGFKMSNDGDDVIFHCPTSFSNDGLKQTLSDDFGATYSNFTIVNGTESLNWNHDPLNLFIGDNVYHLSAQDDGDPNFPSYISYSQDRGLTYNTDLIIGANGTLPQNSNFVTDVFAFEDFFGWLDRTTVTTPSDTLLLFLGQLANSGSTPPDTTAPVIDTFLSEPIQIIEDTVFDDFDHVFCLDDIDGDISILMDIDGTVNTGNRGTYFVDYTCTDEASNEDTLEVHYIVVKKSSSSGGGGSSSGSSSGGITSTVPQLSDIPVLSFQDRDPSMTGQQEGQSIADLFANLFDNRITEGITTPAPSQGSSPLGSSGDTSQRPNPIAEFLQNLFANFFS